MTRSDHGTVLRAKADCALLALLALLSGWASAAAAESEAQAASAVVYATATVRERPVESATSEVTILDRDLIEDLGARTVGELLRFVPGVDVTGNTRGGLSTARIRGGDPNFTLVLLDGVALNDGTYQVGDVFNLEALPTAAVERVEIVRGPLSAFYGSTGLAGAIHVITRRASARGGKLSAALEGGDASYRAAHASFSQSGRRGDLYLALSGETQERRIADESFDLVQLQGRGGFGQFEIAGRIASWHGDDYPEASGGPRFGSGELRRAGNSEVSLNAKLVVETDPRRSQQITAALYRHDLDRTSPAIAALVPESTEDTSFRRARLGWSLSLQPRNAFELNFGVDVEREDGRNRSLLLLPPFLGGALAGDYRLARTGSGAFAELVARRGRLALEFGARIDHPENSPTQASPRLGISYRFSERTRLRGSAGRAFKLPAFFASASPRALGGNPELRPEVVLGADLGLERRFAQGRVETGLGLFYSRYSDLVDFDFETFSHVNRSRVEARGVEARVSWKSGRRTGIALNVTRQRVVDLESGGPLRERPAWIGGLRFDFRPRPDLALHVQSQAVSHRFDQQLPVPEIDRVAGYQVWSANGSWQMTESVALEVRIDNFADLDFQTQIGFPGAGRSFRAGLRYAPTEPLNPKTASRSSS